MANIINMKKMLYKFLEYIHQIINMKQNKEEIKK